MIHQSQRLNEQVIKMRNSPLDKRIEELKRQLRKIHKDYHEKVFNILKEILEIRKKQIKGYGERDLAKEEGINLTAHQISYLFGYQFCSSFTLAEIEKGKLKVSTALFIIKQNIKFREPRYQNKAVKMYENGKLHTTEISRMGIDTIMEKIVSNKEVEIANKQLVKISYGLQEYMKIINSKRNIVTDVKTLDYLINQTKRLKEILNNPNYIKNNELKKEISFFIKKLQKLGLDTEDLSLLGNVKDKCENLLSNLKHIKKFGENINRK